MPTDTVYAWWKITRRDGVLAFHDISEPPYDDAGIFYWPKDQGVPFAARNVLIRDVNGRIRLFGLDT